ncbi:hypothetical protein BD779DRAFT_1500192 [Infundibulicybe gibba]|nr:hypothetical protein BD779DRAFT_1500192 [Infundibulicybe gibba]
MVLCARVCVRYRTAPPGRVSDVQLYRRLLKIEASSLVKGPPDPGRLQISPHPPKPPVRDPSALRNSQRWEPALQLKLYCYVRPPIRFQSPLRRLCRWF